jgi:hypothetical protein
MQLQGRMKKRELSGRSACLIRRLILKRMSRNAASYERLSLSQALGQLKPSEQRFIEARWLSDSPLTVDELAAQLKISRKSVRRVEVRALEKTRAFAASLAEVEAGGRQCAWAPHSTCSFQSTTLMRGSRARLLHRFPPVRSSTIRRNAESAASTFLSRWAPKSIRLSV